ncbi:hypothetical protein FSARC_4564 [Fusarium sarcochroum]|uniref:F-box domain-containing protein n=1 Tax=Fusarium sarcochroum TaxID=1208366 RepID=A0A8H4U1X6_9HYPO|nr:hypothetical protein FSARC_4564 [Fusarium sarcochroum]
MSLAYQDRSFMPSEVASLETLPPEILLPIITNLTGLDTLWNLLRASPRIWRVFDDHAYPIVEAILSGPDAILPLGIAELVRALILVRSKVLPFKDLKEFEVRFLRMRMYHPISNMSPKQAIKHSMTISPELLSTTATSVTVLRSVVATAYQISALSQACLASYLDRLRDPSFRPLHCYDPELRYSGNYGPDKIRIRAWDRVFVGTPVEVIDVEQPSWVEEMRAVRALWIIQLVGEMKRQKDNLGWSTKDVEEFSRKSPADLDARREEVRSLIHYLATLAEARQDAYYRLPQPPPSARWITAQPNKGELYLKLSHPPRPDHRRILHQQPDHGRWGRTAESLSMEACGMPVFQDLTRGGGPSRNSPIIGVKYDLFRPFGLAFWDRWRMHHLGLVRGMFDYNAILPAFYLFAWESILSPDEVEKIKNELRENDKS